MYPHDLRCPTNPFRPEYVGFCERCARKFYYYHLRFQYDFRGNALANLQVLVCEDCEDRPQEQFRPVIIGPDSMPPWPRPTPWHYETQAAGTGLTAPPSPVTRLQVARAPTNPAPHMPAEAGTQPQVGEVRPPPPPPRLAVLRDEEFM